MSAHLAAKFTINPFYMHTYTGTKYPVSFILSRISDIRRGCQPYEHVRINAASKNSTRFVVLFMHVGGRATRTHFPRREMQLLRGNALKGRRVCLSESLRTEIWPFCLQGVLGSLNIKCPKRRTLECPQTFDRIHQDRQLSGIKDEAPKDRRVVVFVDSDYASDRGDRKSISGYLVTMI